MIYFSKNIRLLREKLNLNQKDMFKEIGFKQPTWNGYEKSINLPSLTNFIRIADYFKISEYLLLHTDLSLNEVQSEKEPQIINTNEIISILRENIRLKDEVILRLENDYKIRN